MLTKTVTPAKPVVKLADHDMVAGISRDRLHIRYQSTLLAAMDLTDAIKMATVVLDYARRNGISVPEATADMEMLPPNYDWEECGGYQLRF